MRTDAHTSNKMAEGRFARRSTVTDDTDVSGESLKNSSPRLQQHWIGTRRQVTSLEKALPCSRRLDARLGRPRVFGGDEKGCDDWNFKFKCLHEPGKLWQQYAREHTVAEQTTALDLNFKLAVLTDKSQPSRWSGEGTEAYRQLSAGLHLTTMGR